MMSNPITDCQSVNTCRNVIRSIHLFVVKKSSGVSLDTTSSYLVVEDLQTVEFPKYVKVEYSLTFLSTAGEVPRSNSKGYNIGSAIQLLYGSNDQYYRINNPVNLAYRSFNGACTNSVGSLSEVPFRFGVNALFTCTGTSKFITNIKSSFNYVGAVGAATNSLSDYVSINYPSDISSNTGVRLVFSYIRIGTASDKQYQIIKANATVISESALYV